MAKLYNRWEESLPIFQKLSFVTSAWEGFRLPPQSSGKEKKHTLNPVKGTRKKFRYGLESGHFEDLKAIAKPDVFNSWQERCQKFGPKGQNGKKAWR